MRAETSNPKGLLSAALAFFMSPQRTGTEQRLIETLLPGLACRQTQANRVWCVWSERERTARAAAVRG
ncbi:MAG: hypothetical protein ACKVS8_05715 [Phycisphaerales bacterium]